MTRILRIESCKDCHMKHQNNFKMFCSRKHLLLIPMDGSVSPECPLEDLDELLDDNFDVRTTALEDQEEEDYLVNNVFTDEERRDFLN